MADGWCRDLQAPARGLPLPLGNVAVVHRSQLRDDRRQPPASGVDGQPPDVDVHRQAPALRATAGPRGRAGGFRHLHPPGRPKLRRPKPRLLPGRRRVLGRREHPHDGIRVRHLRRQRAPQLRGSHARPSAPARHAEPPCRAPRRFNHQDLDGAFDGGASVVGPAVVRRVPPGPGRQPGPGAGVPAPERRPVHDQPVPVLRVRLGHAGGDAGVLPVPAQPGARGLRVGAHLHEHVRRPARRHPRGAGRQGVPGRGHRHRRDRVAVQGGRRRGRRHAGQRQGVQRQPRRAPQGGGGHAADARQVGGHVHLRALRRGPQARAGFGAVVRAVPGRPHGQLRHRARQRQRHHSQHVGPDRCYSSSGTGYDTAGEGSDTDGVLRDHRRRAGERAAGAAEQLVLRAGRGDCPERSCRHASACVVWYFIGPGNVGVKYMTCIDDVICYSKRTKKDNVIGCKEL